MEVRELAGRHFLGAGWHYVGDRGVSDSPNTNGSLVDLGNCNVVEVRACQKADKDQQEMEKETVVSITIRWRSSNNLGSFVAMYLISRYAEHKELEKLEGRLLPARDPDPPNSCSFEMKDSAGHKVQLMPKEALKVFLGKFMVTYSTFPHNIFTVNGKNPLILDRDASGQIALTMDILDRDEKVVVRFENGHFWVNPNTRAHMDRGDDKSSLVVVDNYGNQVLDMRYLNKHAVVISALLQYSHAKPVRIEKTKFADVCLGDVGSTGINFNSPE